MLKLSEDTDENISVAESTEVITAETSVSDSTLCDSITHETVCIQAAVSIKPNVSVGEISSFCVGEPVIGTCQGTPSSTDSCSFLVSQSICVQVPLAFSANVAAVPTGISCSEPEVGVCPAEASCTYTIGFFKNHPAVTTNLINAAGGSIILGLDGAGASFEVNAENANDVLSLDTPSPPAPSSPPYAGQYQNLYAQLLAANLNVLNEATCTFAEDAIVNANVFIAMSPAGIGMAGADAVQTPLATFNEGTATGCPGHCP